MTTASYLRRPMVARPVDEEHRSSTPLELFFDLCFVVAVAQAAGRLHHALAEGHVSEGVVGYAMVFFAVWWAWMNFTWFASAYDTDDVLYRLAVLVQIAGVLVLAAGIPRAFDERDFSVTTVGYAVMRTALVAQWLRAARSDPDGRATALRYAAGVAVCQLCWISLLALPDGARLFGWLVLVPAELLVPVWAERAAGTSWHPRHIAERYGLFTLIVLGESVLAASTAVQSALDGGTAFRNVVTIAGGGLLIVFAMWWHYFAKPAEVLLDRIRSAFGTQPRAAFLWGYGHFVIFASAGAVGAGLQVAVDHATHVAHISDRAAAAAIAVPVALYLFTVWILQARPHLHGAAQHAAYPVTTGLVLIAIVLPEATLVIGLLVAGLVGYLLLTTAERSPHALRT